MIILYAVVASLASSFVLSLVLSIIIGTFIDDGVDHEGIERKAEAERALLESMWKRR